jgi:hypothetical protein
MTKTRLKIPHKIETKILIKNKHQCCICRDTRSSQEVQVHHIDGNPSNNILENLAVLCSTHHNLANIGLIKGGMGQGKKLTPEEIKKFKEDWEKRVEAEIEIKRKGIPIQERKQLEILYKFEISKRKTEILSCPKKQQQFRKSNYEFLQQLVIEEFSTGLKLRKILLDAFNDIAVQSIGDEYISLPLIDSIRGLFLHLIGPEDVKVDSDDKKFLLKSLDLLETIGSYDAEISDDIKLKLLRKVCDTIYELAEISSWYKFSDFLTKSKKILETIKKDCLKYEPISKNNKKKAKLIKSKVMIVENIIESVKKLR